MFAVLVLGVLLAREAQGPPLAGIEETFINWLVANSNGEHSRAPVTLVEINDNCLPYYPLPWSPLNYALFLDGALQFQARVAANALEMMRRQLDLAPVEEKAELARLKALLLMDGDLATLNAELSRRIEAGDLDLASPGIAEHLWAVTLAKLAVDQPTYAAYRASLAERGQGKD